MYTPKLGGKADKSAEVKKALELWLTAGGGINKIATAIQESRQVVDTLNRDRQVDPRLLQEPVTL